MSKLLCLILGLSLSVSAWAEDFYLKSSAFENNKRIPILYSCNGDNISPPLSWGNAPKNTQSYVLTFETPDWGTMKVYLWVLYNIPGDAKGLEQGIVSLPSGTKIATNFYQEVNYRGPCPPDSKLHNYLFTLYAIDEDLESVETEIDPEKLLTIIKPHILKKAQLQGLFSH